LESDFLTSSRETVSRAMKSRAGNRRLNSFVIWTVIISMLVAANVTIWTFSLWVFGHPERAFNYKFLINLEKLEPPKQYTIYNAPRGRFLGSETLYSKYYPYDASQLAASNALLKREYVRSFNNSTSRIDYLRGKYEVYFVRDLTPKDLFPSGQVVRAFDPDFPQMIVEAIIPTIVPSTHRYKVGDTFAADGNGEGLFATPLHVQRLEDYQMCFTVVPLVYGTVEITDERPVSLSAPSALNMASPLPVTRKSLLSVPVPREEDRLDSDQLEAASKKSSEPG
jgi:hypothetical protein